MSRHSYGVDTWVYVILPIEKALKRLQERGIRYIEFCPEHFSNLKKREDFIKKANELNQIMSTLDMRSIQVHAPYGEIDIRLASPSPCIRQKALNEMKMWIEFCSLLNSEVLVVHTARYNPSTSEDFIKVHECLRRINIDVFSELSKYAEEYNVRLAIENRLEHMFGSRPRDLISIVEETNPDYIGICFDTGHANANKLDLVDFVNIVKEYLVATHIHDNDGMHDLHLPPLAGNIDWVELIRALKSCYSKPLILEIAGYNDLRRCDNSLELSKLAMEKLLSQSS